MTKEYVLHTRAKLDVFISQAKARGKKVAFRVHAEHPVITVTSTHQKGKSQSILVVTGGVWGIKISAVMK